MKSKSIFLLVLLLVLGYMSKVIGQTTFYGQDAGLNSTGFRAHGFGFEALFNNTGTDNHAFGYQALKTNTSGSRNNALGSYALLNNLDGINNTAVGTSALRANTSGSGNIAVGSNALRRNNTGSGNIAIGVESLNENTLGVDNISIGSGALGVATEGDRNIVLGYSAAQSLTTGSDNLVIGYRGAKNITTGTNNVFIGNTSVANAPSTATTTGRDTSNTIVISNGSASSHVMIIDNNGYMGLGLGNHVRPQNRLEIGSGLLGTSGLRFRGINESSATVSSNGKVLTVNANGDVVLTTDVGSGASTIINAGDYINISGNGVSDNPYIIDAENLYNVDGTLISNRIVTMNNNRLMFDTDANGAIYVGDRNDITNNDNFPMTNDTYRLFVEGGILTEKVKVALRSTADWADYVFIGGYDLPTLKEVEMFIKDNKHLPGIASADELVEKGLDLADMQAKQMQKIEELTLYAIEQDKKLRKQGEEIELLKAQVKALLDGQ
ncbi:hypothetical protein [Winogradskyella sp.]|uniref:hypothetical protein n=1 Tax=Winogradskyella sp. TaxID=1883156 RepID=UPI003BAD5A18